MWANISFAFFMKGSHGGYWVMIQHDFDICESNSGGFETSVGQWVTHSPKLTKYCLHQVRRNLDQVPPIIETFVFFFNF